MNSHQRRIERRSVARFKDEYAPLFNRWPHWTERTPTVTERTVRVEQDGRVYLAHLDEKREAYRISVLIKPHNARTHWRELPYKAWRFNKVARAAKQQIALSV